MSGGENSTVVDDGSAAKMFVVQFQRYLIRELANRSVVPTDNLARWRTYV